MQVTSKNLFIPEQNFRVGCPAEFVETCQERSVSGIVHEYAMMKLAHFSKKGVLKNELLLKDIHHELELDSLFLNMSGASNVLLSKVSFDCLIKEEDKEMREFITFELKIPGTNIEGETVFSYNLIEKLYGSKAALYKALKFFYVKGRTVANGGNCKHGTTPDYDFMNPKHDQYIRHTEQLLVAYLALPQGSQMLYNRLRSEIRGKFPDATAVKVYNMSLHMHSTKTCCASCEYSLIGLMNQITEVCILNKRLGFLSNFKAHALVLNEQLKFSLPKKSNFKLLVTVTANDHDKDHRKQPEKKRISIRLNQNVPYKVINVKKRNSSISIFLAKLNIGYDRNRLPALSYLIDNTVAISGSKATKGSPGTIDKIKSVRNEEMRPHQLNFTDFLEEDLHFGNHFDKIDRDPKFWKKLSLKTYSCKRKKDTNVFYIVIRTDLNELKCSQHLTKEEKDRIVFLLEETQYSKYT